MFRNSYKLSKYNVLLQHRNQNIVYNALTNAILRTNFDIYDAIKHNRNDYLKVLSKENLQVLVTNGIAISNDFSESDYIEGEYLKTSKGTEFTTFTIYPTLLCNFRCVYCIQKSINRNTKKFDSGVVEMFIEKYITTKSPKKIRIIWSGGEPLLEWTRIKKMTQNLLQLCKQHDVHYESHIVTNGYLLTKQIADSFKDCSITHAQITLDGQPDLHNKLRPHHNGGNTFTEVLSGIRYSSQAIYTTIRVNINSFNLDSFEELLRELKSTIRDTSRITISPKMIVPDSASCNLENFFKPKTFGEHEIALIRLILKYEFRAPSLITSGLNLRCAYYHEYSFNISPDLRLYKCSELVGQKEFAYGEIASNGDIVRYSSDNCIISGHSYPVLEECTNCFYLPKCMGKCVFTFNLYDKKEATGCLVSKFNLESKLKLFVDQKMEQAENPK